MRTAIFEQALQEVRLYCSYAHDCIILAEINDINTKDEFIEDISTCFSVEVYSLSAFAEVSKDVNFLTEKVSDKIIIIDEILSGNNESIVGNLNYNRDWLMNFNAKIIIILPTTIIDRIRSSSYNFWSCVSLQTTFDPDKPCIMSPIFIDNTVTGMDSEGDLNRRKSIEKKLYKSQRSVRGIISKVFAIPTHEISVSELKKLLDNRVSQIDFNDIQQVIFFYDFVFDLGQELCYFGHFRYALVCFHFIEKRLKFGYDYQSLQINLQEAIAQTYYKQHKYMNAGQRYAMLIKSYDQAKEIGTDKLWNIKRITRICNNFAASTYFLGDYDNALLWFQFAADFAKKTPGYLRYSQVLYNLALLSHIQKKDTEALEYIETAIQTVKFASSRHYNIITANYQVLLAYILLNRGILQKAEDYVRTSLSLLREELYESNFYILIAHYVYASVHLRKKCWEEALHCAEKALQISKVIQCNSAVRAQIYGLIGEIYYYLGDSSQAKQSLSTALFWNKRSCTFSPEIEKWMYTQVNRDFE